MSRFICHCCAASFHTTKAQDPQRDKKYGTCEGCHELVARDWAKHGFAGKPMNHMLAMARLRKYA